MSETVFNVGGTVQVEATLTDGRVKSTPGQPLKVDVQGFKYDIGGKRGTYDGAVAQAVTDDDVSYLYLDKTATLVNTTVGFPTAETHIPLARVSAANGEISSIYNETVLLAASSSYVGTVRQRYPVDAGVRGGETSASSNNDIAAVAFGDAGEGWNRINDTTPHNYTSGDLKLRLICSLASSMGSNKGTRWKLEWFQRDLQEYFPSSGAWDNINEVTFDVSDQLYDRFFPLEFTLDEADFDPTKEYMCFKVSRLPGHADDNIGTPVYVHLQELVYTGRTVAGEAGR